MTTQDILNRLAENPDRALELYYDGYDKTVCWCYVASDGVPTVYWSMGDQERIADSTLLEAMLKDRPGAHEFPASDLLESQRDRVRKDVRLIRSGRLDDGMLLNKVETTVGDNLWKRAIVKCRGKYIEPVHSQYLCGATISDEDCYWIMCEPDGYISFLTVMTELAFTDEVLNLSDELMQKIKINLEERLVSTCDVVVAGPFSEKL